jgi:hypothetical protein
MANQFTRIQCDEVHPKCGNCLKHGVPCDFEDPEVLEELVITATPGLAADSPSSTILSSTDGRTPLLIHPSPAITPATPLYIRPSTALSTTTSPNNRLLELRLMHQYTSMTSRTLLVNSNVTEDIWQNIVPRMAFGGANYLADAILAVAALHLRSLNPDDKDLVRASHSYMASSLSEYMASLNGGINESNAESLFITASLIAFQSTASRIFIRDEADPGDPLSNYALPLSWFHSFQGVKTMVASSWPWIRNSGIVIPIIDSQPALQLDLNATSSDSFFGHLLDNLEDECALEDKGLAASTQQCYHHAVSVLNWAHKIPHRGAALAFPATVSKRFVDLIEAKRPRALATLACFFALLKNIDSVWWLQGVARREVMGIVSMFEPSSAWWPHLEWPIRIALFEGGIIPPDIWGADWVAEEHRMEKPGQGTSFVNHIEVLAQLLAQQQALPPVPFSGDISSFPP